MNNAAQQNNPFAYWQQTMSHWMPSSTLCNPTEVRATTEPFAYNPFMQNPAQMMQMMQQGMQFWQSMMQMPKQQQMPQFPQFPMMDMTMMTEMMTQWQQMWLRGMGGMMNGGK